MDGHAPGEWRDLEAIAAEMLETFTLVSETV